MGDSFPDRLAASVEISLRSIPESITVVSGGRVVPFLPLAAFVEQETTIRQLEGERDRLADLCGQRGIDDDDQLAPGSEDR